ncbi:MAG: hypothetical protein KME13_21030 [Myxacorys californica WJT36-NPBG1]|jgi:hypothetical protein|nr:hypothetical protein [Myxacorys californica WJT36-NPBG1]
MSRFTSQPSLLKLSRLLTLVSVCTIAGGISLLGRSLPAQAQESADICQARTKYVKAGDWETLESYWNATGHGYFRAPANAQIKVRYGAGSIFGKDRQKQTLNGNLVKSLEIGAWSVAYARMQIKVPQNTNVSYLACSGGVAKSLPPINF